MTARMLDAVAKIGPALFAIDEAHCISQWGPAFRPEYEELRTLKGRFPATPIIALTATADQLTRDHIAEKLFNGQADRVLNTDCSLDVLADRVRSLYCSLSVA